MDNDIKNLFRIGTVTAQDEVNQTVRVTFDDLDNTVSPWLQVANRGAFQDDHYWMPDIDEQVCCFFMPTGNAEGYVLFSVRGDKNKPKEGKRGRRYVRFGDGAVVEYDRAASQMTISTPGTIHITANAGDVVVNGISLVNHTHPESVGTVTGKPQ